MTESNPVALPGGDEIRLRQQPEVDELKAQLTLARQQLTELQQDNADLREQLAFQRKRADDRVEAYVRQADRLESAEAQVTALQQERDAIAEELASNRACNLYTWKETAVRALARAEAAEQQVKDLQAKAQR